MTSCDLFCPTQLSKMTTKILGVVCLRSSIVLNLLEWYVNHKLHSTSASASLRSFIIKEHVGTVVGKVSNNKV